MHSTKKKQNKTKNQKNDSERKAKRKKEGVEKLSSIFQPRKKFTPK
jgi:hypothetical protein